MTPPLHIVPSTSDFGTLAQIREVASQTDQVSRVVCLRDEANCLQEVQTWLGTQVTILAPGSRSTWARALQLFQLVRQSGKRDQSLICWNPGRYDMSSVPLLRIFKQWRTVITTPSKRELAYPGFVGTQILKGSTQIYVSSKYLQSQFPNSQLALPWLNNSREPSHQAELPKKGSIDLKEHFGLSPSSKVLMCLGRNDSFCRLKEAIWIIGILEHLHSDVHLVICGVGPQTDRLRMVADQMVLRPRIHFLSPWLPINDLLAQTQCLLVTADHSGQDWSIQKAIEQRVPVVASRSDGNMECINHQVNGFIGGPDAGGLAKHIHQLLIEPMVYPNRQPARLETPTIESWESVFNL